MIEWKPIEDLPETLKDGRQVLLWNVWGSEPHMQGADIGTWDASEHPMIEGKSGWWQALYECALIDGITHYAEVQRP